MSADLGEYARLYLCIPDDPKFAEVYDDDNHFATYCRLLMIAEAPWPASAHIPATAMRASVEKLAAVGLIDLQTGGRYRIHGLDAERERRSAGGRHAAEVRWQSVRNAGASKPRNADADADPMHATPSNATHSNAEHIARASAPTPMDGWPNLDRDAMEALEERTGQPWSQAGDRQLLEYDRLIGTHGLGRVLQAFDAVRAGRTMTARQLVWPAVKALEPFPSAEIAAERLKPERAPRAPRMPAPDKAAVDAELRKLYGLDA